MESGNSNKYLYTNAHSIIIHNSQKMQTTQLSNNRWVDRQNVFYTHKILFSLKMNEIQVYAIT
jgi:hypothetical protein